LPSKVYIESIQKSGVAESKFILQISNACMDSDHPNATIVHLFPQKKSDHPNATIVHLFPQKKIEILTG
jgi:hypothetical protein